MVIDIYNSGSSESSSDEEAPVKKVPLAQVLAKKKEEENPVKEPVSVDYNQNQKKFPNEKPKEKDAYNTERDSRTVFIKNLPFNSTVDDLWEVFGTDEESCLDCRFIINKETGRHKDK